MTALTHEWHHKGDVITFTWLDTAVVEPDRVYAFAFTPEKKMLLVTDPEWDPVGWLPGGGIEEGETPQQALARELAEEANATLYHPQKIGAQRAEDSSGRQSFHVFYWCRITLGAHFSPQHEVTKRFLVNPDEFLDKLLWGHLDPKGALLLERALALEQAYPSFEK